MPSPYVSNCTDGADVELYYDGVYTSEVDPTSLLIPKPIFPCDIRCSQQHA